MKSFFLAILLLLMGIPVLPAAALQSDLKSAEAALEDVDAAQAVTIANQWKWSRREITSYTNSREVVFKFPGAKVRKIQLPDEKMLVAVAPYRTQTHT